MRVDIVIIVILAVILLWMYHKKDVNKKIFCIIFLVITILLLIIVYRNKKYDVHIIIKPATYHENLDNSVYNINLPSKTTLAYRTSSSDAVYYTKKSPIEIDVFYKKGLDSWKYLKFDNPETLDSSLILIDEFIFYNNDYQYLVTIMKVNSYSGTFISIMNMKRDCAKYLAIDIVPCSLACRHFCTLCCLRCRYLQTRWIKIPHIFSRFDGRW